MFWGAGFPKKINQKLFQHQGSPELSPVLSLSLSTFSLVDIISYLVHTVITIINLCICRTYVELVTFSWFYVS